MLKTENEIKLNQRVKANEKNNNETSTKKVIVPSYDISWEYKIVNILTIAKFTWKR